MDQNITQDNNNKPVPKQSNQIPSWIGFVIIIGVSVVIFGGVFVYQYFSTATKIQPPIQLTQNNTNQIAGWKIYTNDIFGFSFEYPPDFKFSDYQETSANGSMVVSQATRKIIVMPSCENICKTCECKPHYAKLTLSVNMSPSSYLDAKMLIEKDLEKNGYKKDNLVNLNGIEGGIYYSQKEYNEFAMFPYENWTIIATQNYELDPDGNETVPVDAKPLSNSDLQEIFNKTLSTLRYTGIQESRNAAIKNESGELRTYKNDEHKFSFRYPSKMRISAYATSEAPSIINTIAIMPPYPNPTYSLFSFDYIVDPKETCESVMSSHSFASPGFMKTKCSLVNGLPFLVNYEVSKEKEQLKIYDEIIASFKFY